MTVNRLHGFTRSSGKASLIHKASCRSASARAAARSDPLRSRRERTATIPAEQPLDADPQYLIVPPCGFNVEPSLRGQSVLEHWSDMRGVSLWAIRKGNVFADGNLFFKRSGMTIFQTAEIVGAILDARQLGETSRTNSLATDRTASSARLRRITVGRM
jgi:hypothetical protein